MSASGNTTMFEEVQAVVNQDELIADVTKGFLDTEGEDISEVVERQWWSTNHIGEWYIYQ